MHVTSPRNTSHKKKSPLENAFRYVKSFFVCVYIHIIKKNSPLEDACTRCQRSCPGLHEAERKEEGEKESVWGGGRDGGARGDREGVWGREGEGHGDGGMYWSRSEVY